MTQIFSASALKILENGLQQLGLSSIPGTAIDQLIAYWTLVEETNRTLNLTRVTGDEAVTHHFLDTAAVVAVINRLSGVQSAIDIGTGLGVPGVILAILKPDITFVLLDSLDKRIQFLSEVKQRLDLKNILPVHGRTEFIGHEEKYRGQFDICVSRAVTQLPALAEMSLPLLKIGGHMLAMKGPQVQTEMEAGQMVIDLVGGSQLKLHEVIVPDLLETRYVVDIQKLSETEPRFPRKPNKIGELPKVK